MVEMGLLHVVGVAVLTGFIEGMKWIPWPDSLGGAMLQSILYALLFAGVSRL